MLYHQVRLAELSGNRRADLARIFLGIGHELVKGFPRCIRAHDKIDVLVHQLDDGLIVIRFLEGEACVDQGLETKDRVGSETDGAERTLGSSSTSRTVLPASSSGL
ncbi:MAG: hypothetical protein WCK00_09100 [Deltaproteobacteria bacterium]